MLGMLGRAAVGIGEGVGRSALAAGKLGARGALGGGIRRMVTGGVIGGMYGAATSDSVTGTGVFQSAMSGALLGLGIGAATTSAFWKSAWAAGKPAGIGAAKIGAWAGWKGAKGIANFALNHPTLTGVVGTVGLGGYLMFGENEGRQGVRATVATAGVNMAEPYISTSTGENARILRSSTDGLVQGLNSGRHG